MNLNQITIPSTNLFKSVPFYQKLGLKMIVDSVPRYARFVCPEGTTTFSIHHSEKMASGGEGIQVYFECDDLEQEVTRLKAEGLEFEHDPVDQVWLWKEARLRDPDGHLVVLYYASANRVNPPWRVES